MSQKMKTCPFCGNSVNDEQKFCPQCGNNMDKIAPYTQYGYDPYSSPLAPTQQAQTPLPPPPPAQQAQTPLPPPPVIKKKTPSPLRIVLIALISILVIGSAILFLQNASGHPQANTITTVKATATATVNTSATATQAAIVAQNTAPFIPKGYNASLAMENTLAAPSAQWKESVSADKTTSCSFGHSGYVVQQKTPGTYYCENSASGASYTDLIYQAQMVVLSGDCGGLGIRDSGSTIISGYGFLICSDNSYFFYKLDSKGNIVDIIKNTKVNLDVTVNNKIVVVAYGNNFEAYINGEKIVSISDTTYPAAGAIGLVASDTNNSTQTLFTNVKLWTLSSQTTT